MKNLVQFGNRKRFPVLVILLSGLLSLPMMQSTIVQASSAHGADQRAPDVPPNLKVPDGNRVEFHAFAIGVQVYKWTGSSWMFQRPEAILYDADGNVVGTHYAGPTWKSNSGSFVVGQRLAGSTVDPTAIPWLLLKATTSEGPGIFARTTYVQRVHTSSGLMPSDPGTTDQVVSVHYTAEYFFYRSLD